MITSLRTKALIANGVNNILGAGDLFTTGNVFYVNSVTGSDGNDGKDYTQPLASMAQATLSATANNGDIVVAQPGHVETVSAAGGMNLNKAGVTYVALGSQATRATITFGTATTATMTISAANVALDNFFYTQSLTAIVSPIVISAAGVTLSNSYFMVDNASYVPTQMILTTAAANNLTIAGNRFEGSNATGATAAVTIVGGDNVTINDNDFVGAYGSGVGAIRNITTASTNIVVRRNTVINTTASATKGITCLSGTTGVFAENKFGIGSGAAPITAAGAWWMGNWSAAAVATNGTLV